MLVSKYILPFMYTSFFNLLRYIYTGFLDGNFSNVLFSLHDVSDVSLLSHKSIFTQAGNFGNLIEHFVGVFGLDCVQLFRWIADVVVQCPGR